MDRIVLTPAEAANALATTKSKVHELLETGQLPAYRDGKNWKIPETLLLRYIEERAEREAMERRAAYVRRAGRTQ